MQRLVTLSRGSVGSSGNPTSCEAVKQISSVVCPIRIFVSPGLVAIAPHLAHNSRVNTYNIFAASQEPKATGGDGVFLERRGFSFFFFFLMTSLQSSDNKSASGASVSRSLGGPRHRRWEPQERPASPHKQLWWRFCVSRRACCPGLHSGLSHQSHSLLAPWVPPRRS